MPERDVLKLLKADHDAVKKLFARVRASGRREALEQLREALLTHARVEEEVFYPAIRDLIEAVGDEILEAHEEHHTVARSLDDLAATDPGDERFVAKVSVLENMVLQHIDWEEKVLFPRVRKEIDVAVRRELGDAVAAAKRPRSAGRAAEPRALH